MKIKKKALVVTNPMIAENRSSEVTISKFLRIINPIYKEISVVGGNISIENDLNNVQIISFPIKRAKIKFCRAVDILLLQVKMFWYILRKASRKQPVFFWIADKMVLPYIAAKLKRSEINYFIYGNVSKEGTYTLFSKFSFLLIKFMAENATYTCMESKSVINEWPNLKIKRVRIIHLYTEQIRKNLSKNQKKIFGMICRLAEGKHVIESINAMIKLHRKNPDWVLEIIGSGKQELQCRKLIEKNNADDYVKLLGWVEHSKIVEKTKLWKYFLFPSDTEGVPNSLIEMMGRGVPAIASPVGGIRDIILDCKNGFILNDTDAETIFLKMEEVVNMNEEKIRDISNEAFEFVKKEYSLSGARKNIYEELIK